MVFAVQNNRAQAQRNAVIRNQVISAAINHQNAVKAARIRAMQIARASRPAPVVAPVVVVPEPVDVVPEPVVVPAPVVAPVVEPVVVPAPVVVPVVPAPVVEPVPVVAPVVVPKTDSWEDIINHLNSLSPVIETPVEEANIQIKHVELPADYDSKKPASFDDLLRYLNNPF